MLTKEEKILIPYEKVAQSLDWAIFFVIILYLCIHYLTTMVLAL